MPTWSNGTFLDYEQSYRKAADYCAVQDRCRSEMRLKMIAWNIDSSYFSKIVSQLENEGFLDEKRFAINYAGGKFRLKGWGKLKIAAGLRARSVPSSLIQQALSTIDNNEYSRILATLLEKKLKQLGGNTLLNRQKVSFFATSRGFEPALIAAQLKENEF
jgi:regulatory protein